VTYTDYWPYGLLDNIRFGQRLEPAQRERPVVRLPPPGDHAQGPDSMTSAPTAAGANTVEIHWVLPDRRQHGQPVGRDPDAVDDLYARLDYTVAAQSKLAALTGTATMTLTGNLQLTYYAYDVPIVPIQGQGEKGVLPDTDVLHRFSEFSVPSSRTATPRSGCSRRRARSSASSSSSTTSARSWTRPRGTRPFPVRRDRGADDLAGAKGLLSKNARNYLGRITPKAA
jgi:hypothetical protein